LLEEHGLEYDHSLFAHDCLPHWAFDMVDSAAFADYTKDPETWMQPLEKIVPSTKVAEIPGNWDLTDFAALNFVPQAPNSQGYVSPRVLEDNWKEMFTYLYARHDTFLFPLTLHPQSSGKVSRLISGHPHV
jgi:hypothetical protein